VICGYALGGGMELALSCDFRYVADDAKMGFPEINLGIFPGAGGTVRLPRLIGPSLSKELIFSGNNVDGPTAVRIGLANRSCPAAELWGTAMAFAEKLAKKPKLALASAKRSIDFAMRVRDTGLATEMESELFANLFNTEDRKEGMSAFIEKRKPVYKNA
jgi:enoyl-CoA hydratase/carnithine racemase